MALLSLFLYKSKPSSKKTELSLRSKENHRNGLVGAIGNTPLIRINSISDATGCEILGKCGFLNPGGSVKDRVAVKIIEEALESGGLAPGGVVTEGSAGSTAISFASVAPAYGCKCHVVIPDDAAIEKSQILEALGVTVEGVRPVSITHRDYLVNIARRRAMEANELALKHKKGEQMDGQSLEQINGFQCDEEKQSAVSSYAGGYFADQFENLANFRAHYAGTGPEIWEQTGGNVDAFVAAAGTGGTLAGVSRFLQEKKSNVKCFLIDPPGSGLFNKVTRGGMYTREEAEGRRFLMKNDGLFLGRSSAMNCVGAVRAAQSFGSSHTFVTILCDSGMRHLSKFFSAGYLSQYGLTPSASGLEFLGVA
ncbi:cysteine synthase 2 [Pyrus ussuriensis x Pyrus communis]|uniref:cysteine synthase n=1 Tax=Pyrus ussuriensis x Pyrus communis TaxID=2448454 RepID=A0A5N5FWY9_9ROSA|nr:cysteine synthase 2 [Pyrus ussuriensis x Pyrus communis]